LFLSMTTVFKLNLFLLLSIFLFVAKVNAQKKVFFDKKWEKTSEKKASYYRIIKNVNNQFQVEDYYKETNQIQMSGTYTSSKLSNNSREGVFVYYFSNGIKSTEGAYKNGKAHGLWKSWYKDGQLNSETNYEDDLNEGPSVLYHKNGTVKAKMSFINDEKEGISVFYYENGNLEEEYNFFKGKKNGVYKSFYSSGQIKEKGSYEKDSLVGLVESYWSNGNVSFKGMYADNKEEGLHTWFHQNGNKSCEVEYKNGVFVDAAFFDEKGEKIDKKIFKSDLVINEEYPGGNDNLSELIRKQIGKKVDFETAQYQKLEYVIYVKLTIDEKGLVKERRWIIPDENDEPDDEWGFIKNFNNVIDVMPRYKPMKAYNREVESFSYVYFRIVFSKKEINTYTKIQ
jgi:antitoxin component YwqK of YwqJK toxin-antitoxin module